MNIVTKYLLLSLLVMPSIYGSFEKNSAPNPVVLEIEAPEKLNARQVIH